MRGCEQGEGVRRERVGGVRGCEQGEGVRRERVGGERGCEECVRSERV